jgi:hypothetical protein
MANIVQVEAGNMLAASLGITAYTAFSGTGKLRLITGATPGTFDATNTTAGTQTTGGSYPAGGSAITGIFGSVAAGSVTNSAAALSFTSMPATTVCGVEIWDATPTRKWFGPLTANKVTNSGDTLTFATSSITVSIA